MTSLSFSGRLRILLTSVASLANGRDCFVVGGSVRDRLLGRRITDIDIALDGDALALGRALANALAGHFAMLDQERSTARVILDDGPVRTIDITRLRGDIFADVATRDFTIDAIAAPLEPLARGRSVALADPHNGLRDLEMGTVRLVSEQALTDDPIRLLRAVRLAVQLEFKIEPETAAAVRHRASMISLSAAERVRDEIARAFDTPRAAQAVRLMDSLGLLDELFPEVTAGRGVAQPKEHYYDVLEHNIETLAALDLMLADVAPSSDREKDLHRSLWNALTAAPHIRGYLLDKMSEGRSRATMLKFTGLLHDVAKPQTRSPDKTGRVRFFGHADVGAEIATTVMRRLRFSRRETDFVATMIEAHLRPGQLAQDSPPSRRALFRFFRDTRDAADGVLLLSLADALAARGPRMKLDDWRQGVAYIADIFSRSQENEAIIPTQRLITGTDIMNKLAIPPGHEVGRLLAALEEAQASGEVSSREQALEYVRTHQAETGMRTRRPEDRLVATEPRIRPVPSYHRASIRSVAGVRP